MIANYHTHTKRCNHAWGEDKQYVESAILGGLKTLGFSDHCPWVFDDGFVSDTRMTPGMLDNYFNSILDLKKEYKNDINIYVGFESEYIPELMEKQNNLLKDYPVDYMILGEHFMTREPDALYTGFPTSDENFLKKYVDTIIEGLETGKYLYVAHPDLLPFRGDNKVYEKHMLRLCTYLKNKNIPVEINLLGVIEHRHYTSECFLEIAKKAGNTAIIGVDAHTPERLANIHEHEICKALAEKFDLPLIDGYESLM